MFLKAKDRFKENTLLSLPKVFSKWRVKKMFEADANEEVCTECGKDCDNHPTLGKLLNKRLLIIDLLQCIVPASVYCICFCGVPASEYCTCFSVLYLLLCIVLAAVYCTWLRNLSTFGWSKLMCYGFDDLNCGLRRCGFAATSLRWM